MADVPPAPEGATLAHADSVAVHAEVFDGLFSKAMEQADKQLREITSGAPEEAMAMAMRAAEAQAKAVSGDDSELRALQAEMAAKHAGEVDTELGTVWDEFDRDGDGVLSAEENKALTKAYLLKSKEWMPRMVTETIKTSVNGMLGMFVGMAETSGEDANELTNMVETMVDGVLGGIIPAVDTVLEGMLADSDRLADDLLAAMDLDKDGRVTREEFIKSFQQASQSIIDLQQVQQTVTQNMQGALQEGAGGECPMA